MKRYKSKGQHPCKSGLGIHWSFAYQCRGDLQVCIFARKVFAFPLIRPISVALLSLSYDFEFGKFSYNSVWLTVLYVHMSEEKENVQNDTGDKDISNWYSAHTAALYLHPNYLLVLSRTLKL